MTVGPRRWREGKVRPIPGNPPHDRLVSRGILSSLKECLRRSLPRHFPASASNDTGAPQYAFLKAWRNLSGPMGFSKQNQTLGWEPTASRWSAPGPGKRTRREDHAPSHRPQMSSDRLFLDRVARQPCPSPLHRHTQINMPSREAQAKGDISTLPARGHFYFALTCRHGQIEGARSVSRNQQGQCCHPDNANDSLSRRIKANDALGMARLGHKSVSRSHRDTLAAARQRSHNG